MLILANAIKDNIWFKIILVLPLKPSLIFSSDERDAVQKKTFTKWVNSHLSRVSCRISDLYNDLRDGYMLTRLLEVLSGELLVGTHTHTHTHMYTQA